MAVNLKGRSFLTLQDFTPAEIRYLLDLGHDLKAKRRAGIYEPTMKGKHIVLLFEKTSTRTRCSFEVAATQEGAHVTYLDANSSQMGKKESLEDSAKVLGRFFDGIEYRGYDQKAVEDLAKFSGVPVWNGLTDADHPTQILADMMTIEEHCHKPLNQVKVVFPGDVRNNMCYAWMYGCAKMGMHFVGIGPEKLAKEMDPEIIKTTFATARENGGLIEITDNMNDIKDADVIEVLRIQLERMKGGLFPTTREYARIFGLNNERLALAKDDVLVLHPGPMNKGWEISPFVAYGDNSAIQEEVQNGVAVRMALFTLVLTGGKQE